MTETTKSEDARRPDRRPPSFALRAAVFLLVAVLGLVVDLGTKSRVFAVLGMPGEYRAEGAVYWLRPGVFGFQTSLNQGALFGMGQGRVVWLSVLSAVALVLVVAWVFHSAWKSRVLVPSLGLVVAGILGNLYDRLGWHGLHWNYADPYHEAGDAVYAVRDWILVMIGSYHWPNFNIADSMLVCGAILLVLHSFFAVEERYQEEPDAPRSGASG